MCRRYLLGVLLVDLERQGLRLRWLGEQRGAGGGGVLQGGWHWALVAVLVMELVVPLQDQLALPQQLGGGLRGRLANGLGLAELAR